MTAEALAHALAAAIAAPLGEMVRQEVARQLAAKDDSQWPELVTVRAFAASRAISCSTVRAAIRGGRLEVVRIGRAVRLRRDAQLGTPAHAAGGRRPTRADVSARVAKLAGLAGGKP